MPPQAPDKWDDIRQCTIYGPQAMQGKSQNWRGQSDYNFGFQFSREPMDEKESFVINVWSKGINDGKKRPVWVGCTVVAIQLVQVISFLVLTVAHWPKKEIL